MATYYRWRQSNYSWNAVTDGEISDGSNFGTGTKFSFLSTEPPISAGGTFDFSGATTIDLTTENPTYFVPAGYWVDMIGTGNGKRAYYATQAVTLTRNSGGWGIKTSAGFKSYTPEFSIGSSVGYVYSTNASAYPNGGIQDNYYYDQRTTITSPTAPTNLQYPNPITTPTVTVSWDAATSNVPGVTIDHYQIVLYLNNSNIAYSVYNTLETSCEIEIPGGTENILLNVNAFDSNGKSSGFAASGWIPVYLAPTLTVPSIAMQNQPITVNWTAIAGATSYTLQRKSDTDADWVQVYSGPNLTFTETAGAWSSVQYRVQATFSAGTGGWATSESIPVMSASALVISGSDGDLGTLVNDVPYTISTDTGNPISVRTTVNGAVIFAGEVESGAAKGIPVLDLINGEGTIVIEASMETSSGTVSAARAWTYDKDLITFPNGGSPAQMTKEGKIVFPKTLAECVRLPGGRTLDKVMGFPCQIFVGSYTGTGTYGSANPNEVTIPFKPQIVFVSNGSVGTTIPMIRPLLKAKSSADLTVAWTDDGVSWSATSAANQMNANGTDYIVVAFG